RQIFGHVSFADREMLLPTTGPYTLLVEGRTYNAHNEPYAFTLSRRSDAAPIGLSGNTKIDGTLARPGNQQRYNITLALPTRVAFDSYPADTNLAWTRTGPGETNSASFYYSDSYERSPLPTTLLAAGDYELGVDGSGMAYGEFSFRLVDLAATAVSIAGDGSEISGTLAPANETDVFSFTASAGERFAWDDLQSPGSASFRLIDPFGRDATGAIAFNDQTFTTEFTGTYYLLAEGRVSDTAAERAYRFALHRTVDPAPTTINLGDTYVATIVRPTE